MQLTQYDDDMTSESPASPRKDMLNIKKDFGTFVETFVDCACLTIQNFIV